MISSDNLRGAVFMVVAMAGFCLNDTMMKLVFADLELFQAICLRGLLLSLLIAVFALAKGQLFYRASRADLRVLSLRVVGEIGVDAIPDGDTARWTMAEAINAARDAGGRIVAVGTTALRLLESVAAEDGSLEAFTGETNLFILPGYRFKAVDLLMTNFHLPRSTLFMLVCAFAGKARMEAAYAHAIAKEYRFYSYGDACLLEPEKSA